jgi:hypothetical protein
MKARVVGTYRYVSLRKTVSKFLGRTDAGPAFAIVGPFVREMLVAQGIASVEGRPVAAVGTDPPATPLPTPSPSLDIFDFTLRRL